MSPEQALGSRDLDGRSDQYALGCVLYEMLAGAPPYTGGSAKSVVGQHMTARGPDRGAAQPEVPAPVAAASLKAMAKMPEARSPTIGSSRAGVGGRGPAMGDPSADPASLRRRLLAGAAALLAAGAVGVAVLLLRVVGSGRFAE